ncbi:MAG: 3-deoxy-7-phosphoheptulonate synthase [Legionellaceae bacterium]|nr:3-deoxy-7-phosphoheptulonate synthase [Legionellaceae bacterium]
MPETWTPTSWLNCPYPQEATYPDAVHLRRAVAQLHQKKTLVRVAEINQIKKLLSKASRGQAFILQGGDCAESFNDCRPAIIQAQLNLIMSMASMLAPHMNGPVVPIGRIAGQYAKPRSSPYEQQQGVKLPSYRGDLINATEFNTNARIPNPERLIKGYRSAAITLDFINKKLKTTAFYTSHEALHLHYESALTRRCKQGRWYDYSTHLPWLGIRTSQLDSAHVEFLRGIANPIGIKIGPDATSNWLISLLERLNPQRETGRILLITRLGVQHVEHLLPTLIQATQTHAHPVTWACDPMHGNNQRTQSGIKTRHLDTIWQELQRTLNIHQTHNSHLGGLHLEMTPDAVTECLGGKAHISEADLKTAYRSLLDPRLNQQQALELIEKFKYLLTSA